MELLRRQWGSSLTPDEGRKLAQWRGDGSHPFSHYSAPALGRGRPTRPFQTQMWGIGALHTYAAHRSNFPCSLLGREQVLSIIVCTYAQVGSRVCLAAYGSGNGAPQDGWTMLNRHNYYCTELASEDYPCILNKKRRVRASLHYGPPL